MVFAIPPKFVCHLVAEDDWVYAFSFLCSHITHTHTHTEKTSAIAITIITAKTMNLQPSLSSVLCV